MREKLHGAQAITKFSICYLFTPGQL